MPIRYHKQIKLGELVKLNINKRSLSLTADLGPLNFTIGPRGPMISADLPGGLSYRKELGGSKAERRAAKKQQEAQQAALNMPPPTIPAMQSAPDYSPETIGEVRPLAPSAEPFEAAFHVGCAAYARGDFLLAYQTFGPLIDSAHQSDARFMAGITASYLDQYGEALAHLTPLLEQGQPPLPGDEGSLVEKYLPDSSISIQITRFTTAALPLDMTAALFLTVELLQVTEQTEAATAMIEEVFRENASFRLAQLSLADLYMQQGRYDDIFNVFSQSTPDLSAEDDAAIEIMVYWAAALTAKGLFDAAELVYKKAQTRKKTINPDLKRMVRYGRADLYERRGKKALARKYFEQIFAESPVFLDVPQRIAALNKTT